MSRNTWYSMAKWLPAYWDKADHATHVVLGDGPWPNRTLCGISFNVTHWNEADQKDPNCKRCQRALAAKEAK